MLVKYVSDVRLTGNRFLHSKHQNQAVYDTRTGGAKTIVLGLHRDEDGGKLTKLVKVWVKISILIAY